MTHTNKEITNAVSQAQAHLEAGNLEDAMVILRSLPNPEETSVDNITAQETVTKGLGITPAEFDVLEAFGSLVREDCIIVKVVSDDGVHYVPVVAAPTIMAIAQTSTIPTIVITETHDAYQCTPDTTGVFNLLPTEAPVSIIVTLESCPLGVTVTTHTTTADETDPTLVAITDDVSASVTAAWEDFCNNTKQPLAAHITFDVCPTDFHLEDDNLLQGNFEEALIHVSMYYKDVCVAGLVLVVQRCGDNYLMQPYNEELVDLFTDGTTEALHYLPKTRNEAFGMAMVQAIN